MSNRGSFSSRLGFIAAAAGSAVGLGNIWGFPYEVAQGGGAAFVFIYLFFCFALCLPVMLTEVAIGRRSRRNAVGAFGQLGFAKWRGVGLLGVLSGVLILSFYNVLAGWSFGYIFEMASGNFEIAGQFSNYTSQIWKVGSYGLIFIAITALVVSRGAKGIERIASILMPLLVVMMIGVSAYAMSLPHAIDGIIFYLVPDFSEVDGVLVLNAMGQAFFSLSLGMGALITYGSYVRDGENLFSSTVIIAIADVGIALLAGMMIFPLVSFLQVGDMSNIQAGPGLIFETLPPVFQQIGGIGGVVLGTSFFALLCFAALTSTISLLEVPVAYVVDEWGIARNKAVWAIAAFVFVLGIPSLLGNGYSCYFTEFITYPGAELSTSFLDFVLNVANDSFLPMGGCLIVIFAAHVWKRQQLTQEIAKGAPNFESSIYNRYFRFALPYVVPGVLILIFFLTVLRIFVGLHL